MTNNMKPVTFSNKEGNTLFGIVHIPEKNKIENTGIIINCSTSGKLKGWRYLGGFVGQNSGIINNCFSAVNVTGHPQPTSMGIYPPRDLGGFVGYNIGGIEDSFSTGDVEGIGTSIGSLGGFANRAGDTTNCYSTGRLIASSGEFHGFAGSGTVISSTPKT